MRESLPVATHTDITLPEAREMILAAVRPLAGETVLLNEALGRVVLEEVVADRAVPPRDNSAMDGFAVRSEDIARPPTTLRVVEDLPAGRFTTRRLEAGEAIRIMTGAAIPEGADRDSRGRGLRDPRGAHRGGGRRGPNPADR
jgi:molybdopterin molybdotransferase